MSDNTTAPEPTIYQLEDLGGSLTTPVAEAYTLHLPKRYVLDRTKVTLEDMLTLMELLLDGITDSHPQFDRVRHLLKEAE